MGCRYKGKGALKTAVCLACCLQFQPFELLIDSVKWLYPINFVYR